MRKIRFFAALCCIVAVCAACDSKNEPKNESENNGENNGSDNTETTLDIVSTNKVNNFYGTIYEVILRDGSRMYFGLKNSKEVRMGCWSYFYDGAEDEYDTYSEYEYKGNFVVPKKVKLEGTEYTVTELYDMAEIGTASSSCENDICTDTAEYPNTKLLSVYIPNTIRDISFAFNWCTSLKSVEFEEGSILKGCSHAFFRCTSLTDIVLPNTVSDIEYAFKRCTSLESITLPESVTATKGAFSGCTALKSVVLPEELKTIGDEAFKGCTALKSVVLPEELKTIGDEAFKGCTALKSVVLPEELKTIGDEAFKGCTALKSVVLPEELKTIGDEAFKGCTALETINLDKVTSLGYRAFQNCKSLKKADLSNLVGELSYHAFEDCESLETLILGANVTEIGWWAFGGCKNLQDLYCYATTPPSSYFGFQDLPFVLHVPASAIEAYRSTSTWSDVYGGTDGERTIVAIE